MHTLIPEITCKFHHLCLEHVICRLMLLLFLLFAATGLSHYIVVVVVIEYLAGLKHFDCQHVNWMCDSHFLSLIFRVCGYVVVSGGPALITEM